jgi:hypothetical protein
MKLQTADKYSHTVILTLAHVKWIQPNAADLVLLELSYRYSTLQDKTPLEMVKGKFTAY